MNDPRYHVVTRLLNRSLALSAVTYVLLAAFLNFDALAWSLGSFLFLLGPALFAAHISSQANGPATPRLAMSFVLAGFVLLPNPGGLVLAALAGIAGAGGGVAGTHRRGAIPFTALVVGVGIAEFFVGMLGWPANPGSLTTVSRLALLAIVIEGFAIALGLMLDAEARDALLAGGGQTWRSILLEAINVPCGWLIAVLLWHRALVPAIAMTALVLLLVVLFERFERVTEAHHRTRDALGSRSQELEVFESICRRLLSEPDPERVFALVDRETRKIVDVDLFEITLIDQESGQPRTQYRRRRTKRAEAADSATSHPVALQVIDGVESLRIDDLAQRASPTGLACRSMLAAPLIVGRKTIGALLVGSRKKGAYSDHQLRLIRLMAQQTAIAVEGHRARHLATLDSLTGFFLRDYFFRRLDDECKRVRRYGGEFALLMVDLDGFKEINDQYGHVAGDHYLRGIGETIREQLRAADLACRYGGDEFCMLLPETDGDGARIIAERIREAVGSCVVGIEGLALRTTASIGIAVVPQHDSGDLEGLVRKADEALYRAKRSGRDRVVPFAA